jgi:hypothetical protein
VVLHFVLIPSAADAQQKAPLTDLVDRGDQFGGLDRVALLYERDTRAELDGPWSIEATSLAVWIVSRCCMSATPVPSLMVLVAWPAAASTTNGSMAS